VDRRLQPRGLTDHRFSAETLSLIFNLIRRERAALRAHSRRTAGRLRPSTTQWGARGRGFFERLLATAFSLIRPDGTRFDDRTGLLDALTVSPARPGSTDHRVRQPAVVCAVMKEVPDGPQQHRNIRVFTPRVSQFC
jgi:hypothetical protein